MTHLELVRPARAEFDASPARADFEVIERMVEDGASVLDVGCGDGRLMALLASACGARVRGLERDKAKARVCVTRGLSVVQGDAEAHLAEFPGNAFDYVVFSQSFQCMARPHEALRQAGRVGGKVIVSIRNAAHWRNRVKLLWGGRTSPVDGASWAHGELKRACSVRDFAALAREIGFVVETAVPLSKGRAGAPFARTLWRANVYAEEAVFLLSP